MAWIGVDLDGTLAHYNPGEVSAGAIGAPIEAMLLRVREWVRQGREVRIFTARVSVEQQRLRAIADIHEWCRRHGLPALQVTCVKDYAMLELWDDRAIQIITNTGRRADGKAS